MTQTHYIPYVGITANEMIKKLDIHFISTKDGIKKVDSFTGESLPVSIYEKKLFLQSEWEKSGYGQF